MHLDIRITLVFAGLLLGSWRRAQEPWRPLLFSLAIEGLLLARGAGALAATASLRALTTRPTQLSLQIKCLPLTDLIINIHV